MNAKQILEEAGLENSHWGKIIIEVEKRGSFTSDEYDDASSWPTCACGQHNLPKDMYIDNSQKPKDGNLHYWGEKFPGTVRHNNFESAAETLIAIENRVKELLQEMK